MSTEAPGDWKGGSTAVETPSVRRKATPSPGEADFRFTTAGNHLYAFGYKRPEDPLSATRIVSLAAGKAQVARITLLENMQTLPFHQTAEALTVKLPPRTLTGPDPGYVLRVEGTYPLGAA